MIPLLIAVFFIGFSVGCIIGAQYNSREIDKVIKEAKEQLAISKKLIEEAAEETELLKTFH